MNYLDYLNVNVLLGLKTAILLISLDTIFGWLLAVIKGEFSWDKVPQFLTKNILPYMSALVILAVFAHLDKQMTPIFFVATGAVDFKFGKDIIIEKIKGFFS